MSNDQESNVEENPVQDEESQGQDHADNDVLDEDEQDDVLDDDAERDSSAEVEDGEEEDELEDSSGHEISQELMDLAVENGLTEAEVGAMGKAGLFAYLSAKNRLKSDDKKEPEEDPFALKLSEEDLADLPSSLVREIERVANAAKAGIASAKGEVEPLKDQVRKLTAHIEEERRAAGMRAFVSWCDQQDDGLFGSPEKPNHKVREKLFNEAVRLANRSPDLSVEDACEIAFNKVFKGKRKQQARREVAKASKKHTDSAVGRGSNLKKSPGSNGTRKASEERVRALFQKAGMR